MRRYNIDHQPAIVDHDKPAVMPGDSHTFTKEQVEAGLSGVWSEEDPRRGLKQEHAFKRRRDSGKVVETVPDSGPHNESA